MIRKRLPTVAEYLQNVRSISNNLSNFGAPVTDSELMDKILSGMDPIFCESSNVIHARDFTIAYKELYEKFLDREILP